jgi:toxin ParE1/3/4
VPEKQALLSADAAEDIREILLWSQAKFGMRTASRYKAILQQALRDVAANPNRPGSERRGELAKDVRSYHLSLSRQRARTTTGSVQNPRHLLIYRARGVDTVEILRILHDSRDLARHLP